MRHSQPQAAHREFAADFKERYGVPPIAGGEFPPGGGAPAAAPPPPQAPPAPAPPPGPAPAPAPQAQPGPQPAPQPGPGQAPQPQPGGAPQPGQPGADPAAAPPVDPALQPLLQRMDEIQARIAPPAYDPLAVELGMVPPPADPQFPPQGVPQGGAPGYPPVAQQPQQPQVQPGQPQPPMQQPGQAPEWTPELVQQVIADEARRQAQAVVDPWFQRQEAQRRRSEGMALLEDYPDLRDPQRAQALVGRSRQWATDLGAPQLAGEPGFVELVYLAGNAIASAQAQLQPGQPQVQPGAPVTAQPGVHPGVTLETPGGTPPPNANANDPAAAIVAAGRGGTLTSFWGGRQQ